MKITIAQLNPIVGDISGNFQNILNTLTEVNKDSLDLIVFSELFFLLGILPGIFWKDLGFLINV